MVLFDDDFDAFSNASKDGVEIADEFGFCNANRGHISMIAAIAARQTYFLDDLPAETVLARSA